MQATTINIRYYAGGRCSHNVGQLFNGLPSERRYFPASSWLIEHPVVGNILYDTGYSSEIMRNHPKYWIYRQVTPVDMTGDEAVSKQLMRDGIDPFSIEWVILSHLHPDHIGDAKAFINAKFIVTPKVYATLSHPKLRDLVFFEFLPEDILERCIIVNDLDSDDSFPFGGATKLLGQDDLIAVSCDGHAAGQLCLYLPHENLFIGSDISWGSDLVDYTDKMNPLPKLIMSDFKEYEQSIELVKTLRDNQIELIFSHDSEMQMKQRFNKEGR